MTEYGIEHVAAGRGRIIGDPRRSADRERPSGQLADE